MTDPRDTIRRLQEEAEALPDGPAKVALLEEAVRHADVLHDLDRAYVLRKHLMRAARPYRADVMLVAFAWCLAQSDQDPQRFEEEYLLWVYSWVIRASGDFADIERPRLEELFDDMQRRYGEAGASLFLVQVTRRDLMMCLGDPTAARKAHASIRRCRDDDHKCSAVFVACKDLEYHVFQKQWHHALRVAQPVLDGRVKDVAILPYLLSEALYPLFRLGRIEEARQHQRRGYRLICRHSHFVIQMALHLRFLVLVGDLAQAKRVLERHLIEAFNYVRLNERFAFFLAARLWTDRLVSEGTEQIKVRLPPGSPGPDAEGKTDVHQVGLWFAEQAQAIAGRFDARNGNDYFQEQIDELPHLLRLATT